MIHHMKNHQKLANNFEIKKSTEDCFSSSLSSDLEKKKKGFQLRLYYISDIDHCVLLRR